MEWGGLDAGRDQHRGVGVTPGLHANWRDLALADWRWPHFTPRELACRCGRHCRGEYFHHPDFLDALEALRTIVKRPLIVTSARRCRLHNAAVGGAPLSQHRLAMAVDISVTGWPGPAKSQLLTHARRLGFTGIGLGTTFLHLDRRAKPALWDYNNGGMKQWSL